MCPPPFQREGANFENFKKGEPEKKFWGGGNQKGRKIFKNKGGTQLFKLNLGTVKNKNEDFYRDKLA